MAEWDGRFFGEDGPAPDRDTVEAAMVAHMEQLAGRHGTPWPHAARHMLGLRHGEPGSRRWRQVWSDHRLKSAHPAEVSRQARAALG
jgi:tRNA-dihydrouridine synthase A